VQHYLPGALLTKVDRLTMAHGLEARSPFLDHQVMELAACLPASWKVRRRQTKRILREAFADLLPPDVVDRAKAGFAVPLGPWFRGSLRGLAGDFLLDSNARLWNLMQPQAVAALLHDHWTEGADHGKRLWTLIVLEAWLSRYEVSL
jgi:asparagine synthase (glutamine-hydrolysing)